MTGLVLITSGFLKLYPVEPFELYIFSQGIIGWDISCFFARLIISAEIGLGVLLLINIRSSIILRLTSLLLIIFTFFLVYLAFIKRDTGDCHCFGQYLSLNPLESIIKNVVLIGILIFVSLKNRSFHFRFQNILFVLIILASLATPIILNPPDQLLVDKNSISNGGTIDITKIGDFDVDGSKITLNADHHQKRLLCFFSPSCRYCKMAAQKLSIILFTNHLTDNVYYIFPGDTVSDLEDFWKESQSEKMPYKFIPVSDFFDLSGPSLPAIYFTIGDSIVSKVGYRTLFEKDVVGFFNENQ